MKQSTHPLRSGDDDDDDDDDGGGGGGGGDYDSDFEPNIFRKQKTHIHQML